MILLTSFALILFKQFRVTLLTSNASMHQWAECKSEKVAAADIQ